jgi:hypothetical protein
LRTNCNRDSSNNISIEITIAFGSIFAVFPTAQSQTKILKSYQANAKRDENGQTNNDRRNKNEA